MSVQRLIGVTVLTAIGFASGISPAAAQVGGSMPPPEGEHSAVPRCEVAEDPTYGVTRENPVLLGGGAVTVAARERKYLEALRGPGGQSIRFTRSGSVQGPDKTILDRWELMWAGRSEPFVVFLDVYRWSMPRAPQGLVCGAPIGLSRPPADSFDITRKTARLAAEWGSVQLMQPVPLSAQEPDRYGVAWDQFRRAALVSYAATQAGAPIDPEDLPSGFGLQPLLLVAYPLTCDGRLVRPRDIDVVDAKGAEARKAEALRDNDLAGALPGVTMPEHALGQQVRIVMPRRTDVVRIRYEDRVCEGDEREVRLPVDITSARPLRQRPLLLEAGTTPPPDGNPIRLQVVADPAGRPRIMDYAGGPDALLDEALAAMAEWTLDPLKWNDAPMVTPLTIPMRATVLPVGVPPPGALPTPGAPSVLGSLATTTWIRTPDVEGVAAGICPVSPDPNFGRSAETAIPVGGGVTQVVERARMYLLALRGEKGQGLNARRVGDGPAPPAAAMETFEVTRNGETAPTRLYFDAGRFADVMAPQGFVCAGPMLLRPPR